MAKTHFKKQSTDVQISIVCNYYHLTRVPLQATLTAPDRTACTPARSLTSATCSTPASTAWAAPPAAPRASTTPRPRASACGRGTRAAPAAASSPPRRTEGGGRRRSRRRPRSRRRRRSALCPTASGVPVASSGSTWPSPTPPTAAATTSV